MMKDDVKKSCLCADLWKTFLCSPCVLRNLLWFLMLTFKEEATLCLSFFFFLRSVRMSENILCLNYGMCNFILHISLMYNLFCAFSG